MSKILSLNIGLHLLIYIICEYEIRILETMFVYLLSDFHEQCRIDNLCVLCGNSRAVPDISRCRVLVTKNTIDIPQH